MSEVESASTSESRGLNATVSAGSSVPRELTERIGKAVSQAVLTELAVLDLGPGVRMASLAAAEPRDEARIGDNVNYGIFVQINF